MPAKLQQSNPSPQETAYERHQPQEQERADAEWEKCDQEHKRNEEQAAMAHKLIEKEADPAASSSGQQREVSQERMDVTDSPAREDDAMDTSAET